MKPFQLQIQLTPKAVVWVDHDQRLVRVWFGTDRKIIMDGDVVDHVSALQASEKISYVVPPGANKVAECSADRFANRTHCGMPTPSNALPIRVSVGS